LSARENVGARHRAAQSSRKRRLGLGLERSDGRKSGGRLVITIAISLCSTSVVTAGLGFVFWTAAAHSTTTEVVGRASAVISAMQLIAAFATLGLQTLLIAELPRLDGFGVKRLVVTSLGIASGVAFAIAAGYAFVYHIAAKTQEWIYATPMGIALFGLGTAVTTVTIVLDGALIGVQQSGRQVSRNLVFSLVKLIALPLAALAIGLSPQVIFSAWLLGNLISLLILGLRTKAPHQWLKTMPSLRGFLPIWRTAAGHHWVNVAIQLPPLTLPIMVATQLSNQANAGFYAALLMVNFVWIVPVHLGTAMFALRSGDPEQIGGGLNAGLQLSAVVSVLAAAGAPFLARPMLAIFGAGYEQASNCLIALATCTFASAVKSIYVAVRRAQGALGRAARAVLLGAVLELGAAELGLKLGAVTGVGIAVGAAMVLEAAFFWPSIQKARRQSNQHSAGGKHNHSADERKISESYMPALPGAMVHAAKADHVYKRFRSLATPSATQSNNFSKSNGARKGAALLPSKTNQH
jgi:O-antigen/teichoic acid export membrane protein